MEGELQNLVPVAATELLKKSQNKEDLINIYRKLGKKYNYIILSIGIR